MKKYMDKFKWYFHVNKKILVFLYVIVVVGIVSGTIFSIMIDAHDQNLVSEYLKSFFNDVSNINNYNVSLANSIIFHILLALMIWFLGVSVIGFFIIIFIIFFKSFVIGFSIGSIIFNFKFKGILFAIIYFFPHHVISLYMFIFLSAYALILSLKIIRCFGCKQILDFRKIIKKYIKILIISIIVLMFSSIYEIYIMPELFKCISVLFK